jgi:hypothetical protein
MAENSLWWVNDHLDHIYLLLLLVSGSLAVNIKKIGKKYHVVVFIVITNVCGRDT